MIVKQPLGIQKKLKAILLILAIISAFTTVAQKHTSVDLEFRFNPIYSRGFRQPLYAGEKPGFFTMQRTRLILNYSNNDSLKAKVIFQDRRAWGETSERQDVAEVAIFRAWVEPQLDENWSIKLGRQGLIYDDEHLFGELNWGGTLAHDGAVTKYEKKDFKFHLGLALNANRVNELKREFYQPNFYKNMQFLWLHKDFKKINTSFIFINRGLESADTTVRYTQTFGTNTTFNVTKKVGIKGIYYHQMGNDIDNRSVNAAFWSAQLLLNPSKRLNLTLGIESTSGTDQNRFNDATLNESSTFDILYGLLHGHFGYLDYFYVLIDPVFGVKDSYIKLNYSFNKKWRIRNNLHHFQTSAQAYGPSDTQFQNPLASFLGVENDFILTYKPHNLIKASLGHSIMFGSETLDAMFGGTPSRDNQFFYMVITASPRIFENK